MIFGERVKQARELRGFTQKELAKRLGCGQSMIAKVEGGLAPSTPLAEGLSQQLGFPLSWFEQAPCSHFPLGTLQFRAKANITARQRDQAYQYARTIYEIVDRLSARVRLVPVRLPEIRCSDPEEAAAIVRSELGLSPDTPIKNLFNVLEKAGVVVIMIPFPLEGRDGFSGWAGLEHRRPVINIVAGRPGDRIRFTTAHELGELLLTHVPPGSAREEAADHFAGAFLLPADAIKGELRQQMSLTTLARLKPKWGVSMQAMLRRARQLDVVTDRQYRYLYSKIGALHWRIGEPETASVAPEKPRALRRIVELLYGEDIAYGPFSADTHLPGLFLRELMRVNTARGDLRNAALAEDSDTSLHSKVVRLNRTVHAKA